MWFSAIKVSRSTLATHIFKNRNKKTKMLMADAQIAAMLIKMANGQAEYQGKLLEARQSDWKDEFILLLLNGPNFALLSWAVFSAMTRVQLWKRCNCSLNTFQQLPILVPNNFCRCHSICIRIKSN